MATIYTKEEIAMLREGGKRLAEIIARLSEETRPGVNTNTLNDLALQLAREGGDEAAFLHYTPAGAPRPFPAAVCVSINDEVVHGIPNENPVEIADGDIVKLDMGLTHKGLITDTTVTVGVGNIDEEGKRLIETARTALTQAIAVVKPGNTIGDIGAAIWRVVEAQGFNVPRDLGGHGVGHKVHEEPFVPNYGQPGKGVTLQEGMVLAIEPIVIAGSSDVVLQPDGYTFRTKDGSHAAEFEHTIAVTKDGAEVLTKK